MLLVLLTAAAGAVAPAEAHRPLLTGPVAGAYSTYEAALKVPWVTSSWSAKRVVEVGSGAWARPRGANARNDSGRVVGARAP